MKTKPTISLNWSATVLVLLFACALKAADGATLRTATDSASGLMKAEVFSAQPLLGLAPHFMTGFVPSDNENNGERSSPSILRAIVGTDRSSISERIAAVHALGWKLNHDTIAVLSVFVKSRPPGDGCNLKGLRVLKNDLLNVLESQIVPPPGQTDLLIQIYQDPAQDEVLRDYAIQHLAGWYEIGVANRPAEREKIVSVLRRVVRADVGSAGTALLGLHRMAQNDPVLEAGEISCLALSLIRATNASMATRVTALQVCAERGNIAAVPTAEALAQSASEMPLRLSAIAALGHLGGSEHVALLHRLDAESNGSLQVSIRVALQRLHRKQCVDLAGRTP